MPQHASVCPYCEEESLEPSVPNLEFDEDPSEIIAGKNNRTIYTKAGWKRYKVTRGENSLMLGGTPLRILYMLACNFNDYVSTEQLILFTWHADNEPEDAYRNVNVHICRLRKIIGELDLQIVSASGYGYRLMEAGENIYSITHIGKNYTKNTRWTGQELKFLADRASAGDDIRTISKVLGRSETAIKKKLLYALDMHDVPSDHSPRPWTEEDDETLRSLNHLSVFDIAREMDRGEIAIRSRLFYRRLRGHAHQKRGRS